MKNFLTAFLFFCIWAIFGMWYYSCVIKGLCADISFFDATKTTEQTAEELKQLEAAKLKRYNDSIDTVKQDSLNQLAIQTDRIKNSFTSSHFLGTLQPDGDTIFYYPNPLTAYKNKANIYVPQPNLGFVTDAVNYMNSNPSAELVIYAAYSPTTETATDTLGLNRAQFLKDRLIRYGLNEDRIATKTVERSLQFDSRGRNYEAILVEFKDQTPSNLNEVEESVTNKTLYSSFAQQGFKPDATLKNYAIQLKSYLQKYPDKRVSIVGHTDYVGEEEDNLWIGEQRAKLVMKYLTSIGIDSNKMTASSKGETDPKFPNTTDANRAMNRRIEIKIN
jgi:outer membrane protein OmpA-like peptidoglycan-associated protein